VWLRFVQEACADAAAAKLKAMITDDVIVLAIISFATSDARAGTVMLQPRPPSLRRSQPSCPGSRYSGVLRQVDPLDS
jgi:hypothetical protein